MSKEYGHLLIGKNMCFSNSCHDDLKCYHDNMQNINNKSLVNTGKYYLNFQSDLLVILFLP